MVHNAQSLQLKDSIYIKCHPAHPILSHVFGLWLLALCDRVLMGRTSEPHPQKVLIAGQWALAIPQPPTLKKF